MKVLKFYVNGISQNTDIYSIPKRNTKSLKHNMIIYYIKYNINTISGFHTFGGSFVHKKFQNDA